MKINFQLVLALLPVFIDHFGNSLILPIIPFLVSALGGTSQDLGLVYSSYSITQLISVYAMGYLSDKLGRKFFMVLSLFGSWCGPLLQALSPTMYLFIAARAFTGLLGGSLTVAQSYIADVYPPEKRGGALSNLMGVSSVAYVLGPFFGGLLSQSSYKVPYFVAAACSFVVFVLSSVCFRETNPKILKLSELKKEKRILTKTKISLKKEERKRIEEIDEEIKELTKPLPKNEKPKITWNIFMILILIQRFFSECALYMQMPLYALYLIDEAGYDSFSYSILTCLIGIVNTVTPFFLYPFLTSKLKWNMVYNSLCSAMSLVIGFVVTIFTHDIWSSGFFVLFYMFGYMLAVSLTPTVLSVQSPPEVQGTVFGISALITSIAGIISPMIVTSVYTVSHVGSILTAASLSVVNTVILFVIYLLPGGKHCAEASMYEALLCDWIVTTTKSKEETNKTEDEKENEDNSNKEETNKTEDQKENEDNNNKEEEKSEDNSDRVEVAIETQETASVEQTTVVKEEEKVPTIV